LSDKPAPLEGIAEGVGAIVLRALEKRPDSRFASMDDLARELSEFVVSEVPEGPMSRRKTTTFAPGPRSGRSLPPPATSARPAALRRRWISLAAVALALAGGAMAVALRHRAPPSEIRPVLGTEAHEAVAPTAITDLALPRSASADAQIAFREGLQAVRDASWSSAASAFERARTADPTMATAHLRYAMIIRDHDIPKSRDAFREAIVHKGSASERDQAFIDAFEPYLLRDPPDPGETSRRLEAASARWPGDAELVFWQAWLVRPQNPEHILSLVERCVTLDPQYADCWQTKARALRSLGRLDEAGAALDRCLAISPGAVDCVRDRVIIEERSSRCAGVEELARRWIAKDPTTGEAYSRLAWALYAQGRPAPAVHAAVEQSTRRYRDAGYLFEAADIEMLFAEATGDFEAAEQIARKIAASGDDRTRPDRPAYLALHRALVNLEIGRPAEAARVARAFFAQRDVRSHIADRACDEKVIRLLALARGAGVASRAEYQGQRDAWMKACEERPRRQRVPVWFGAHAAAALTADDAREALASMPSLGSESLSTSHELALGRVYWLAGDMKAALGHLAAGSAHCESAKAPIDHLQSHYRLGAAREAVGEKEAACAAYGVVLGRWGQAKESVTAKEAARRSKALGCPTRRGS
jgi:serine/threonine-protein kinase